MAKDTRTPEERAAALLAMMGDGDSVITLKTLGEGSNQAEPAPTEIEQEGKKAPATPELVASVITPLDITTPLAAEPQATSPAPAPNRRKAATTQTPAVVEQPNLALPAPESEPVEESEPPTETSTLPAAREDDGQVDLSFLFRPTIGKKGIVTRLTERHFTYLSTLGTILGNRTSPPDIIYNLIEQLIEKYDKEIQKGINKKMRASRTPPPKS